MLLKRSGKSGHFLPDSGSHHSIFTNKYNILCKFCVNCVYQAKEVFFYSHFLGGKHFYHEMGIKFYQMLFIHLLRQAYK